MVGLNVDNPPYDAHKIWVGVTLIFFATVKAWSLCPNFAVEIRSGVLMEDGGILGMVVVVNYHEDVILMLT